MSRSDWVLVGDLHLDKLSKHFPNAIQLQIEALREPLDYAKRTGSKVCLLGDVGHYTTLSGEATYSFFDILAEYEDDLDIYVIVGNHDYERDKHDSLKFFRKFSEAGKMGRVRILSREHVFEDNGVTCCMLPHPLTRPKKKTKESWLCFGHFARPGAVRDNGTKMTRGGVEHRDNHFYCLGHLHTHQSGPHHLFPGTLYQTTFGESLPKGFCHLIARNTGGELEVKWKFIKVKPKMELRTHRVTCESDIDAIENAPHIRYRVYVDPEFELPHTFYKDNPSVIEDYATGRSKGFETPEYDSSEEDDVFDLTKDLPEYLESRGLNESQISVACKLVDKAKAKLGLS
jgi:DNA repair exonuclease SbcCD nuclease subunit